MSSAYRLLGTHPISPLGRAALVSAWRYCTIGSPLPVRKAAVFLLPLHLSPARRYLSMPAIWVSHKEWTCSWGSLSDCVVGVTSDSSSLEGGQRFPPSRKGCVLRI